tara:strand:- start:51416 stop:51649 length:234 start_codon:yes stop_codon:yes gene_type:complete
LIAALVYFLNIFSILSVTRKPPTTLMVAKIIAIKPRIEVTDIPSHNVEVCMSTDPAAIIAPTNVIPDIALEPDISGV